MPKNEKSTEDVQVEQSPNLEETVIVDDETLKEVKDNVQNDLVGKGKKKKMDSWSSCSCYCHYPSYWRYWI